ncbi:hypothetical protein KC347_g309 [Hortaea werneckii]|nr:hypothetical protein KC347_g309 [Hortaea werneckii]
MIRRRTPGVVVREGDDMHRTLRHATVFLAAADVDAKGLRARERAGALCPSLRLPVPGESWNHLQYATKDNGTSADS